MAVPGAGYGANVVKLLDQILAYKDPGDGYPEGTPAWQKEGFEILVKRGIINSPDVWKARFNPADHGRRDPGDHRQNVTGKEGAGHG